VVQILKFKNISFVGLQEIRVSDFSTDKFSKLVKTINKLGYSVIYNGNVALIYHSNFKILAGSTFRDSDDRIIGATFSNNNLLFKVASVYAPTAPRNHMKHFNSFWNNLSKVFSKSKFDPAYAIVMGDYNTDASTETNEPWFRSFLTCHHKLGLTHTIPVPSRIYKSNKPGNKINNIFHVKVIS
jgi:exonuclease III